jgi:hypothetical protein
MISDPLLLGQLYSLDTGKKVYKHEQYFLLVSWSFGSSAVWLPECSLQEVGPWQIQPRSHLKIVGSNSLLVAWYSSRQSPLKHSYQKESAFSFKVACSNFRKNKKNIQKLSVPDVRTRTPVQPQPVVPCGCELVAALFVRKMKMSRDHQRKEEEQRRLQHGWWRLKTAIYSQKDVEFYAFKTGGFFSVRRRRKLHCLLHCQPDFGI